jgi:hypothetical protein
VGGTPGGAAVAANQGVDVVRKVVLLYILVGFLSVAIRFGYLLHDQTFRQTSGLEMERAAAALAREGTIGDVYPGVTGKSAHVSPLYPVLLAGLYRAFGSGTIAGRLAQEACATAATTAGILLLPVVASRARLSASAGWVAALTLAVLPINLWIETSGTWEQPYSALALLALFLMFCNLRDCQWGDRRTVVITGVLLGVVSLLSPGLLPAGALMVLAEFAARRHNRARVARASLGMALVAGLVLLPWVVRNYVALGGFVPFRSNFGLELAIGNNATANGQTYITSPNDPESPVLNMHPFTSAEERNKLLAVGELAYMREKQRAAFRWMAENPGRTAELTVRRFRLYWFPPEDLWARNSPMRGLKAAAFGLISFAAFACLVLLIVTRSDRAWLLAAVLIGPSLVYMVTHVESRYRYPIFGISAVLASHFVLAGATLVARRLSLKSAGLAGRCGPAPAPVSETGVCLE